MKVPWHSKGSENIVLAETSFDVGITVCALFIGVVWLPLMVAINPTQHVDQLIDMLILQVNMAVSRSLVNSDGNFCVIWEGCVDWGWDR